MWRLLSLGPPAVLAANSSRLDDLNRQTKRLGLLIYLACDDKCVHRRDELMAVFWPDSDEHSARNCLRQSLHVLRGHLGDGVLVGNGDQEVAVDPGRLETDVAVFLRALGSGCAASALDLYRADFLHGFYLPELGGFERWVEGRRQRLRSLAVSAAKQLAHTAEGTADLQGALYAWRRTLELAPFDEGAIRRLVTLLLASGNRADAIGTLTRFQNLLMTELEVEPTRETRKLLADAKEGRIPEAPSWVRRDTGRRRGAVVSNRREVADRFWMGPPGPGEITAR